MARLERLPSGWLCHGAEVLAGPAEVLSCWFRVRLDDDWTTRDVLAGAVSAAGGAGLRMTADAQRSWTVDGHPRPDLEGCVDVDVAATPLTNTFPIRRLGGLTVGQEVTTPIAWVDVPSLRVTRVEQTYRRLPAADGLDSWEYRDAQHGAFVLTVDDAGLVVDYEGFCRRVGSSSAHP
jgi:hypothetical protein